MFINILAINQVNLSLARLGSKATKVRERGKAKLQKWVNIYFWGNESYWNGNTVVRIKITSFTISFERFILFTRGGTRLELNKWLLYQSSTDTRVPGMSPVWSHSRREFHVHACDLSE